VRITFRFPNDSGSARTAVINAEETPMTAPHAEAAARALDAADPLRHYRDRFHLPLDAHGNPVIYFVNNSLGLMPKKARDYVTEELESWGALGHSARFMGTTPWYRYHEIFRESGARLVGAHPDEIVYMNGLSVNLHLMLVSFYQPNGRRTKILADHPTFPSDNHAIQTHLKHRGVDPISNHVRLRPRDGEHTIRTEDVEAFLAEHGKEIALVLFSGVNFVTGQYHDLYRITQAAHLAGAVAGFDLAHAAGNVPMKLHDWGVDFAVWCTYKYMSAGPGGPGGTFVHRQHGTNSGLHRFAGWWGQDSVERLNMDAEAQFEPASGADGWQISNPPIFSMAPLRASLELYDEVGFAAFREKSLNLTGFLEKCIRGIGDSRLHVITPADPSARGCQLSIAVEGNAVAFHQALERAELHCDFRAPNVIRFGPFPFVNTYHEAWRASELLGDHLHLL